MEARFWRGSSKPCQGACPRSGDLQVDLDRVCACATLPLSGQAGVLKTDSETYAVVLVLTLLRDFLLRRNRMVRFAFGHMRALLRYIVTERRRQLLAVVGEKLCIVCSARDRDIGHAAVEQILSTQLRIHVNQDAVGSLSLAGVAGHCIAMVEMQMLVRV